jgi:casein kinase 1
VPSRRDDLEATALMLIHLLTPGGLPWTRNGIPKTDHAHNRIKKMKRSATPEDLCSPSSSGVSIPSEFEDFLRYCRGLKFTQTPDYKKWHDEFGELLRRTAGTSDEGFVWPPPPLPVATHPMPQKSPGRTPGPESMEDILDGLAKMGIQERTVLGDKKNIEHAIQAAKQLAPVVKIPLKPLAAPAFGVMPPPGAKRNNSLDVIVISDDEDSQERAQHPAPMQARVTKANEIVRLTRAASNATDNGELAAVVFEFVRVLKDGRGKTLTREGFRFLDVLHKQLADPSVFIANSGLRALDSDPNLPILDKNEKLVGVRRLKEEVARATRNTELGKMVAEFGELTTRGTTKTVTKDGVAFLEGLAARLKALQQQRRPATQDQNQNQHQNQHPNQLPPRPRLVPAIFETPVQAHAVAAAS